MTQEEFNARLNSEPSLVKCNSERLSKILKIEIKEVETLRIKRASKIFEAFKEESLTKVLVQPLVETVVAKNEAKFIENSIENLGDAYEEYSFEINSKGEKVRSKYRLKKNSETINQINWESVIAKAVESANNKDFLIPDVFISEEKRILLINVTDVHLNKKSYTSNITLDEQLYNLEQYIVYAVKKAQAMYGNFKIILHIGDDLINSEHTNATTKGTPQDCLESAEVVFEKTIDTLVPIIRELSKFYEIEVICVNGNHAYYLELILFQALKKIFESEQVTIHISKYLRTYHIVDNIGFMFVHKKGNVSDLPTIFNTEHRDAYKSKYKYIITADEHSKQKTRYSVASEKFGIEHIQCTSISCTDKWHHDSNYIGNHARMLCLVFDEHGIEGEYYVREADIKSNKL
jgi:hypothetical protein